MASIRTSVLTKDGGDLRADDARRRIALTAGIGLLFMAVLAPLAHFGVLQDLIVPTDAAATVANITASEGLFRLAIATRKSVVRERVS